MNKKDLKRVLLGSLLATSMIFFSGTIYGEVADEECSEEIIISYFPEPFVKKTLKDNKVPEVKWSVIAEGLKGKNEQVVRIVEEKASKMDPNPLKDPKYRNEAIIIFREALLVSFTDVMNKNGITDEKQIQTMLDDIQKQKAKRFSQCLEKHMKETQENQ